METQEYQMILVGIDGSNQARKAFEKAVEVAKRNKAHLIVAHIIENRIYGLMGYSAMNANLLQDETDNAKVMLEEYKKNAHALGMKEVEYILTFGSPKVLLTEELPKKYHIDLILVGQTGLNAVERFMTGSVSAYVIRNAPCDVLVVREEKEWK